jgi:hypothetical protein
MHKRQIAFIAIICISMTNIRATAEEAAKAPPSGPANVEFQKVFSEWKTFLGDFGSLMAKYRTAQKEERSEIEKQWKEMREKGNAMKPRLIQAAEKAFAESPNGDKDVTELLQEVFTIQMKSDDFENAARLGKLLADNNAGDLKTVNQTAVAAIYAGDINAG